jgi:hypothetical protein
MTQLLAFADEAIFAVGSVIAIVVLTAALSFGYARFQELGEEDARRD